MQGERQDETILMVKLAQRAGYDSNLIYNSLQATFEIKKAWAVWV